MAWSDPGGIHDSWETLKANPVFRRAIVPRSIGFFVRSPIARAMLLTAVALVILEIISKMTFSLWPVLLTTIVFWFVVYMVQRGFCWIELHGHATTGTLDDYLNSGLKKEDVFMGIAYPAVISERIAVAMIIVWFIISSGLVTYRIFFVVLLALHVMSIFAQPYIFMPDAEGFLRRRGPVALFFIGIGTFADLLIWFTVFFAILFGAAYLLPVLGITVRGDYLGIGSFVAAMFVAKVPQRMFATWQLKRFYSRYDSFEDLFDNYLMQGEVSKRLRR